MRLHPSRNYSWRTRRNALSLSACVKVLNGNKRCLHGALLRRDIHLRLRRVNTPPHLCSVVSLRCVEDVPTRVTLANVLLRARRSLKWPYPSCLALIHCKTVSPSAPYAGLCLGRPSARFVGAPFTCYQLFWLLVVYACLSHRYDFIIALHRVKQNWSFESWLNI